MSPARRRSRPRQTPSTLCGVTQDEQILTFFISSLSREVLLQVSSYTTAATIWNALLQSFSSQSRARVIQLRSAIEHTRKGDMSAAAYFTKMVSISDELAATGKPLDEDDVVDHILQGLLHKPDYNGFVSAISTRALPPNNRSASASSFPCCCRPKLALPPRTLPSTPPIWRQGVEVAATQGMAATAAVDAVPAATTTTWVPATLTTPMAAALEVGRGKEVVALRDPSVSFECDIGPFSHVCPPNFFAFSF